MMRYKNHLYILFGLFSGIAVITSCSSDYLPGSNTTFRNPEDSIIFGASIDEEISVYSRAEETGNPGLDSIYIAYSPWNMDFYIQLNTIGDDGTPVTEYGTYEVPSAYEGRLESKDPDNALNWMSLTKEHTFYSWTVPWIETNESDNSDIIEPYTPSAEPLTVNFYNSSEADGFEKFKNNSVLEGFVGAKSVPLTYDTHGKYVDLTFHHLVSKIIVESIIMIKTDGSVQEDLQADMTFIGMPVQATFYPHPTPGDGSGAPLNSRPYVGAPYERSADEGVTYYIQNKAGTEDIFYICPEIDFSQIDYQIKLNSEKYLNYDTYYGTFDDVVFERTPGMGYDRGVDDDSKILHAGEIMKINIVLIPGIGPGLRIIISDWSTDKPTDAQYHSHPGIYSDAELQEWLDLLYSLTLEEYNNPPAELEWLFEMYGYEKDGKKYIPLYENVVAKKGNSLSNIFPVPQGYIIDGLGHTITMNSNGGIAATQYERYFNVGPVRNVYITDGTYTIYIDPDGYVWVEDENGELVNSNNQLPEIEPPIRGYDINIKGYIRPTQYFNDKISG